MIKDVRELSSNLKKTVNYYDMARSFDKNVFSFECFD
jgi:hypothetical protein